MEDYKSALAVTLRAALAFRDMTQAELAEKIGVAEHTVYRWCKGDSEMKAVYFAPVADALDIPDAVFTRPRDEWDAAMRMIANALAERNADGPTPR